MSFVTLFPARPKPPRVRKRRPPKSEYLHVREVKGGAWQARVWLGVRSGGSLNLGLFTRTEHPDDPGEPEGRMAEWAAARASREFRRRFKPGVSLRAVIGSLMADRLIPDHVLPPRVKKTADGRYIARVRKAGRIVEAQGVFDCPWAAHEAMLVVMAREFPLKPLRRSAQEAEARLIDLSSFFNSRQAHARAPFSRPSETTSTACLHQRESPPAVLRA